MARKILQGVVRSKSGAKTVAVEVASHTRHPKYGKAMKRTNVYLAHDESDSIEVGSMVSIEEARPFSARKRWRVVLDSNNEEK